MKIWTTEQEAAALAKRFVGVNRAQFARDYGVKGGQANIYNHIKGLRPINLDAARAYANGFKCTIEEISPRLAMEVAAATRYTTANSDSDEKPGDHAKEWLLDMIDETKVRALDKNSLISLQTAILIAAAQVGLDIKKNGV